jgi:nucleoside 2-deoxyribosyltransferase
MKRIYLAGPYSHKTWHERVANVAQAREAMVQLLAAGFAVFCPHTMTEKLEHDERLTYNHFMDNDLEWLATCDGILMLKGWFESRGSKIEHDFAWDHGINVFHSVEDVVKYYARQLIQEVEDAFKADAETKKVR